MASAEQAPRSGDGPKLVTENLEKPLLDDRLYRVIRLPNRRFRIVGEGPFTLPRDAAGQVDVPATTQMVTDVVERWVREHPDQWLWFHRRWR